MVEVVCRGNSALSVPDKEKTTADDCDGVSVYVGEVTAIEQRRADEIVELCRTADGQVNRIATWHVIRKSDLDDAMAAERRANKNKAISLKKTTKGGPNHYDLSGLSVDGFVALFRSSTLITTK